MSKYTAEEEQALLEEILDEEETIRQAFEEEEREYQEYQARMHRAYKRMAYSQGDEEYDPDPYSTESYDHSYPTFPSSRKPSPFDDPDLPF